MRVAQPLAQVEHKRLVSLCQPPEHAVPQRIHSTQSRAPISTERTYELPAFLIRRIHADVRNAKTDAVPVRRIINCFYVSRMRRCKTHSPRIPSAVERPRCEGARSDRSIIKMKIHVTEFTNTTCGWTWEVMQSEHRDAGTIRLISSCASLS